MADSLTHSAADPLLGYLDKLASELRTLVTPAIRENDAEAIHDARVATRRLSAALDLLEPVVSPKRLKAFAKTLKKLRRTLGELRDTDVLIDHLDEFSKSHPAAAGWLKSRLSAKRAHHAARAGKHSPVDKTVEKLGGWWAVHGEVVHLRPALRTLLTASLHEQLAGFSAAAAGLAAEPVDESTPPAATDPHAVRIAGKALRYTLEMAREAGLPIDDSVFKHFKALQDHLGDWHDYVVLVDTTLSAVTDDAVGHHEPALAHDALALATGALGLSEAQLAKFVKRWAEQREGIAAAVRDAAPLSADVATPPADDVGESSATLK